MVWFGSFYLITKKIMCIVSMVFDEYSKKPYETWKPLELKYDIQTPSWIAKTPLELFEELVEAARRLDVALGLPDCEDPNKSAWLTKVKEQIRQTEIDNLNKRLDKQVGK